MNAPRYDQRTTELARLLEDSPLIRAINFHNTPRARATEFEDLLKHCREHFAAVTESDLDLYLKTGQWHKPKPGLIFALYDSTRNQYDVMAPLLERYGFIGWFFIITEFIKTPVAEQVGAADRYQIDIVANEYGDGRFALNWEELRALDGRHVIASHARRHVLLTDLDEQAQRDEIFGSQNDFEMNLGHRVRTFVSFGGPAFGENQAVDHLILSAGYQIVFSNYRIQRLPANR